MRVRFEFAIPEGRIELPIHYNYFLQSMIYANISEKLADFLHHKGFTFEKRHFKLFTFSRLMGKHRIIRKEYSKNQKIPYSHILFFSPISFYLSSPHEELLQEFANRTITGSSVSLNGNQLFISSVQVLFPPVFNESTAKIKMLSPMAARTTLYNGQGKKKSYYYSPLEKEFPELIKKNLLKKFHSFHGNYPQNREFNIRPVQFTENRNLRRMNYKGFVIKGYDGIYELSGSKELICFAYEAGLGEKNSQGLGMFSLYEPGSGRARQTRRKQ